MDTINRRMNYVRMNFKSALLNKDTMGRLIILGSTMPCKNIGTNDKFCRKVALLRYTERLEFRSQSRETASKRKP